MTAFAALVRDVLRQARATGLTATLFAVSALATIICVTANYTPISETGSGSLTVVFGKVQIIDGVSRDVAVRYLQFLLAGLVADTLGILVALAWTAGFLPTFLDPRAASVLLAKPASRTTLFLGKVAGVVLFVGASSYFSLLRRPWRLGLVPASGRLSIGCACRSCLCNSSFSTPFPPFWQ